MIEFRETKEFVDWLSRLKDRSGRSRIVDRLLRLAGGNFGDVKSVGGGVSELRCHFGPGYRIYFTQPERDGSILILLIGGDKDGQPRDIARAKAIAQRELRS